jgi:hypothetical protein
MNADDERVGRKRWRDVIGELRDQLVGVRQ